MKMKRKSLFRFRIVFKFLFCVMINRLFSHLVAYYNIEIIYSIIFYIIYNETNSDQAIVLYQGATFQ
jgi:hypothetical protein